MAVFTVTARIYLYLELIPSKIRGQDAGELPKAQPIQVSTSVHRSQVKTSSKSQAAQCILTISIMIHKLISQCVLNKTSIKQPLSQC